MSVDVGVGGCRWMSVDVSVGVTCFGKVYIGLLVLVGNGVGFQSKNKALLHKENQSSENGEKLRNTR